MLEKFFHFAFPDRTECYLGPGGGKLLLAWAMSTKTGDALKITGHRLLFGLIFEPISSIVLIDTQFVHI